jgi:asparagine synthase (glutamine-hydrolysing)
VAAQHENLTHVLVRPLETCPLDLIGTTLAWNDSPGGHLCMAPTAFAVSKAHQECGVKTVLVAAMGNLTISYDGLRRLPDMIRRGEWLGWMKEATGLRTAGHASGRTILRKSFFPFVPRVPWGRPAGDLLKYSVINPCLLASDDIRRSDWWEIARADGRTIRARGIGRPEQSGYAIGRPGAADADARDPTIDKRLVEFCFAIPEEQYLRDGVTKRLLRRAMAGRLPAAIMEERRKGLVGADWYLRVAPYKERFAEAVAGIESSETARRCLDIPRMRRLIDEWPRDGWWEPRVAVNYRMALCRGLAVGAFIRHVEEGCY